MEITQFFMTACFAGASSGFTYLWATRNRGVANPIQSFLGSGANLADLEAIDLQIDAAQKKYDEFVSMIKSLPKDEKLQIWRSENEPMKAQISELRQKRFELAVQLKKKGLYQSKMFSIEAQIESDAKFNESREKLNQSNYNIYLSREKTSEPENDTVLDLQPLNAVVLKKNSKFDRLKSVIFEHPKVAQFVFGCAVFWESAQRFAVSFRYKLSIL